jgi:transcriptional regulator with XRE-family HTH domain
MAHRWEDLKHKSSPERRAQIARRAQETIRGLKLDQLREARNLTQTKLAQSLRVNQGAVSKMEKRADMYVSTLRSYLQAMGAKLEIRAVFPDGEVVIEQFEDLDRGRSEPEAQANHLPHFGGELPRKTRASRAPVPSR